MTDILWDMLSFEHGTLAVVVQQGRLCRVCYECSADNASETISRLYPSAERSSQPVVRQALKQLTEYFLGKRRTFNVPLDQHALSDFARKVHQELVNVPYGSVVTYGELAAMVGSPGAARAVGRVMSSNPYPLIVPCHRVVNVGGGIGQYSAANGTKTKAWLIDFERELEDQKNSGADAH